MINYNNILSERVQGIKFSGIRKFFDIAATMDNIVSLSVGEPDFKTPFAIRRTAIHTLEKGKTTYTSNAGLDALREAINDYLTERIHCSYNPKKEILVTVGGSEAIDAAIRALVNFGDEVLVPEPSFVCYAPMVELTGGVAVPIETRVEDKFKLTAEQLIEKITPKTKALILPFPNNPTGAVMRREDLEEIAAVLRDKDIIVISDEIYSELTYGGTPHVSIAEIDGMKERTIVINGFSKAFAMTGWRLGFAAGPEPILTQMLKIHQYAIMSAPTFSQYAAIDALKNGRPDVERMKEEYNVRRKFLVDALNDMGLTCFNPYGAFYVFPSVAKFGLSSEEFCQKLLYEEKLAVVPGTAFGDSGEGYVRISYAYSQESIAKALKRLKAFTDRQ